MSLITDSRVSRRIYVASSWRNPYHELLVKQLETRGHEIYNFRDPGAAFGWKDVDPDWRQGAPPPPRDQFRAMLRHELAKKGFARDHAAMEWADTFVLLLPCGRSAHLEAGWACGRGKETFIYLPEDTEPELMYLEADRIVTRLSELFLALEQPVRVPVLDQARAELRALFMALTFHDDDDVDPVVAHLGPALNRLFRLLCPEVEIGLMMYDTNGPAAGLPPEQLGAALEASLGHRRGGGMGASVTVADPSRSPSPTARRMPKIGKDANVLDMFVRRSPPRPADARLHLAMVAAAAEGAAGWRPGPAPSEDDSLWVKARRAEGWSFLESEEDEHRLLIAYDPVRGLWVPSEWATPDGFLTIRELERWLECDAEVAPVAARFGVLPAE